MPRFDCSHMTKHILNYCITQTCNSVKTLACKAHLSKDIVAGIANRPEESSHLPGLLGNHKHPSHILLLKKLRRLLAEQECTLCFADCEDGLEIGRDGNSLPRVRKVPQIVQDPNQRQHWLQEAEDEGGKWVNGILCFWSVRFRLLGDVDPLQQDVEGVGQEVELPPRKGALLQGPPQFIRELEGRILLHFLSCMTKHTGGMSVSEERKKTKTNKKPTNLSQQPDSRGLEKCSCAAEKGTPLHFFGQRLSHRRQKGQSVGRIWCSVAQEREELDQKGFFPASNEAFGEQLLDRIPKGREELLHQKKWFISNNKIK